MDVILYSKIAKINGEINGKSENNITATKIMNITCSMNATSYTSSSTTDTFYIPIVKGCFYTVQLTKKEGQTVAQSIRVSVSSNVPALNVPCTYVGLFTIPQNIDSGEYLFEAFTDGYLAFSTYYDSQQSISSATAVKQTTGVQQKTEKNSENVSDINQTLYGGEAFGFPVTDFEIGSIYASDGINYNDNTHVIRTPANRKVIIQDGTIVKSSNPLIGTVFAFKYKSDGTYVERTGATGDKSVKLTEGYYRFALIATNSSDVITVNTIPTYYANTVLEFVPSGGIVEDMGAFAKADDVSNWEVGSIYGSNGTNYDENTHAVRTPNGSKIQVDSETTFVCENENIATVYAFKYNSSGAFVERYGSANYKSVTIPAGYYRFVLVAVDSTVVITSATIEDYSEFSAFVTGEMGKLTGELARQITVNKTIGSDFVIDSSFMKRGINVTEIGQISGAQAFCVYNGKYYSCSSSTLYRQDSSFTLETSASVTLGHGNALMLGSNGIAYASGWDNDTVYVVDLANMTITDMIALPVTGYTTVAVDDVNEIMYIFSRSDTTSTVDNWTFTVWDYANDNIILTKKITNAFAAIQGVDFYNGRILVAWGLGTNVAPSGMAVYDTNGNMLNEYRATAITFNEPEGICFDRATNRLLFSTITQKVFEIEPKV